VFFFKLGMQI